MRDLDVSVLSDRELELVAFAARASGAKDDEAMERIIAWAERASVEAELFGLVIEGAVMLDWDPIGEDIRVKLTEAEYRGRPDASSPPHGSSG